MGSTELGFTVGQVSYLPMLPLPEGKTAERQSLPLYSHTPSMNWGEGGVGVENSMFHYTSVAGFKGIRSSPIWKFVASQPPGDHPRGAYFTTLGRDTPKLAERLRIPRAKVEYFFEFTDVGDLKPLRGGRGEYIFYSPVDYKVGPERQTASEKTEGT